MKQPTSAHDPSRPDSDLAEQAKPGHGVPSQDPDPAAQYPIGQHLANREKATVFVGVGVMAGIALGAAAGMALAGPVGIFVGGTVGAIVGAFGAGAVSSTTPNDSM